MISAIEGEMPSWGRHTGRSGRVCVVGLPTSLTRPPRVAAADIDDIDDKTRRGRVGDLKPAPETDKRTGCQAP